MNMQTKILIPFFGFPATALAWFTEFYRVVRVVDPRLSRRKLMLNPTLLPFSCGPDR